MTSMTYWIVAQSNGFALGVKNSKEEAMELLEQFNSLGVSSDHQIIEVKNFPDPDEVHKLKDEYWKIVRYAHKWFSRHREKTVFWPYSWVDFSMFVFDTTYNERMFNG